MRIADLASRSILILGLGVEGRSTLRFLRRQFPDKVLGLADAQPLERFSGELQALVRSDSRLRLHLGRGYLDSLKEYDVIVKSPGIPVKLPEYKEALSAGRRFTSQ